MTAHAGGVETEVLLALSCMRSEAVLRRLADEGPTQDVMAAWAEALDDQDQALAACEIAGSPAGRRAAPAGLRGWIDARIESPRAALVVGVCGGVLSWPLLEAARIVARTLG